MLTDDRGDACCLIKGWKKETHSIRIACYGCNSLPTYQCINIHYKRRMPWNSISLMRLYFCSINNFFVQEQKLLIVCLLHATNFANFTLNYPSVRLHIPGELAIIFLKLSMHFSAWSSAICMPFRSLPCWKQPNFWERKNFNKHTVTPKVISQGMKSSNSVWFFAHLNCRYGA